MFEELVEILCDQLPLSPEDIKPESRIKDDLGADSLDVLQLLMALEEEKKGVVIPDDVLPTLITVGDIVFKIGPRINASGRIQNGKEAVGLLVEKDFSAALEKANQINQYNETRKDLDKAMTEEANQIVENLEDLSDRRTIVIFNEEWHKGVIGIVASRLTEVYYRPAVVLTRTNDMATGSARSVSGFDVYKAIEHCRDLLENFGTVFLCFLLKTSALSFRVLFRFISRLTGCFLSSLSHAQSSSVDVLQAQHSAGMFIS